MKSTQLLRTLPLLLVALLGLVACVLVACSGSGDDTQSGGNALSNEQSAPTDNGYGYGTSGGYGGYDGYGTSGGDGYGYGTSGGYGYGTSSGSYYNGN